MPKVPEENFFFTMRMRCLLFFMMVHGSQFVVVTPPPLGLVHGRLQLHGTPELLSFCFLRIVLKEPPRGFGKMTYHIVISLVQIWCPAL